MVKQLMTFRKPWIIILLGGLVLFGAADAALISTTDPNYVPTVLLVGAFLIPVTFVAFVYQKAPSGEIPLVSIVFTFIWGGALGVVVAGFLEYDTLKHLGVFQLAGVAFVEESSKLIIPLLFFAIGRFRHEADGLLFGIAAGMGFAALESMGYGFTSYINSMNSNIALDQTLLVRGILSPAGHAAWTGIVCAVIWKERERHGQAVLTGAIAGTFLLAVILHASWDYLGTISSDLPGLTFLDYFGLTIVGLVSFGLLIRRFLIANHGPGKEVIEATLVS